MRFSPLAETVNLVRDAVYFVPNDQLGCQFTTMDPFQRCLMHFRLSVASDCCVDVVSMLTLDTPPHLDTPTHLDTPPHLDTPRHCSACLCPVDHRRVANHTRGHHGISLERLPTIVTSKTCLRSSKASVKMLI